MDSRNTLLNAAFNKFTGRELNEDEALLDVLWTQPNNWDALKAYLNSATRVKKFLSILPPHQITILPPLLGHIESVMAASEPAQFLELLNTARAVHINFFFKLLDLSADFFKKNILINEQAYHLIFNHWYQYSHEHADLFFAFLEKIGAQHIEQTCQDFLIFLKCVYPQKKVFDFFSKDYVRQWAMSRFSDTTNIFSEGKYWRENDPLCCIHIHEETKILICALLPDDFISKILTSVPLQRVLKQDWMPDFIKHFGADRFVAVLGMNASNPWNEIISAMLAITSGNGYHLSTFQALCANLSKEKFDSYIESNEIDAWTQWFKLINHLHDGKWKYNWRMGNVEETCEALYSLLDKKSVMERYINNVLLHGLESSDPEKIILEFYNLPETTLGDDVVDSLIRDHTMQIVQPLHKRLSLTRDGVGHIVGVLKSIPEQRRCEILALFEQRYDFYACFRNYHHCCFMIKSELPNNDHQQDKFEQKYRFSLQSEVTLLANSVSKNIYSLFPASQVQRNDQMQESANPEIKNKSCVIS